MRTILLLLFTFLFFSSCKKEKDDQLELIASDEFLNSSSLDGWNDLIAATYTDVSNSGGTDGFNETLKIYRQSNNRLENLCSIYLGVSTLYHRFSEIIVDSTYIVTTQNNNIRDTGYVSIINLNSSSNSFKLDYFLAIPATIDKAVVFKNHLLLISNNLLSIYNLSSFGPVLIRTFTSTTNITKAMQVPNGFLIINSNGYAIINCLDPSNIQYTEFSNSDLKGCKKGFLYGNYLFIAGDSKYVGNTKIVKLDINNLESPVTLILKDDIPGKFLGFSYDNRGNYYVQTDKNIVNYIERNNTLVAQKSINYNSFYVHDISKFYATNDYVFVLDGNGLKMYKFD